MSWFIYHNIEEASIAGVCFIIALRFFFFYRDKDSLTTAENRGRLYFVTAGFSFLGISSAFHAAIHILDLPYNLLFQTILGYSFGFLMLILAITMQIPEKKKYLILFYLLLLTFLIPDVYKSFPDFKMFRPLAWLVTSYFSGILCVTYILAFQNMRLRSYLYAAISHLFICIAGILLFFPDAMGSQPWLYGHLLRPIGFILLLPVLDKKHYIFFKASILYKALLTFAMLSGIPILLFGIIILYHGIETPNSVLGSRLLIFFFLFMTLAISLISGNIMTFKLVKPILRLKKEVDILPKKDLGYRINAPSDDEVGELAKSFNSMISELEDKMREQVRLSRLATTGELSAKLAHEIKNPLNAIQGAASYISKNFEGALISEFTKIITEEVSRINGLIINLLTFAKPTIPQMSYFDMNGIIKGTIELVTKMYSNKGVRLDTSLDTSIPEILVDQHLIRQVLLNLLINALDATEKGGRVRVSAEAVDGNIKVCVVDSGKGIKEEDINQIFDPFFTKKTDGTGLGLSIAENILKEHGGKIAVESFENKGSTFCFFLPIKRI
ncbi:MAG: ATP-binding protein [Nitrospirota bacterium]